MPSGLPDRFRPCVVCRNNKRHKPPWQKVLFLVKCMFLHDITLDSFSIVTEEDEGVTNSRWRRWLDATKSYEPASERQDERFSTFWTTWCEKSLRYHSYSSWRLHWREQFSVIYVIVIACALVCNLSIFKKYSSIRPLHQKQHAKVGSLISINS